MADSSELARDLLAAIQAQQRSIHRLTEMLAAGAERPGRQDGPTPQSASADPLLDKAINWEKIAGAQRLAAWEGLASFVEEFVLRYSLQFEVLWQVYRKAYREEGADSSAAMDWLNAYYDNANRLKGVFVSCREEHIDATPKLWMTAEARREFQRAIRLESGLPLM